MNARETIFAKVRSATQPLPNKTELPSVEELSALRSRLAPPQHDVDTLVACFAKRWQEVGGVVLRSAEEARAFLAANAATQGYADPAALELTGSLGLDTASVYDRPNVDVFQFGITRASLGVAETGTIVLKDADTPNRLAALAPWVHIATLRRGDIVPDMQAAVARLGEDPSIIFVTGPSKTADIEGILIEGVHGPGKQACWLV